MKIRGMETIRFLMERDGYFVKCIVNSNSVVFFPGTIQHRDMKVEGLSYEDDYLGNAMAAVIKPGKIEIRFHEHFTDEAVRIIFQSVLKDPEMIWARGFRVTYQGRNIIN